MPCGRSKRRLDYRLWGLAKASLDGSTVIQGPITDGVNAIGSLRVLNFTRPAGKLSGGLASFALCAAPYTPRT